jgi:galactokinase
MPARGENLSLKQYVETRLNLLTTEIETKIQMVRDEIIKLIEANDLRYQQRFDAQGKALDAAFSTAKSAVDAALAASDKAAVKTELTSDKRFADLGDLIREQFRSMSDKFDSTSQRITSIESRLNISAGEMVGTRTVKSDTKSLWALGISILLMLLTILSLILRK